MWASSHISVRGSLLLTSLLTSCHPMPASQRPGNTSGSALFRTFSNAPSGLSRMLSDTPSRPTRSRLTESGLHRTSLNVSAGSSTVTHRKSSGAPMALSWPGPGSGNARDDSVTPERDILSPEFRVGSKAAGSGCDQSQGGVRDAAAIGSVSKHPSRGADEGVEHAAVSTPLLGNPGNDGSYRANRRLPGDQAASGNASWSQGNYNSRGAGDTRAGDSQRSPAHNMHSGVLGEGDSGPVSADGHVGGAGTGDFGRNRGRHQDPEDSRRRRKGEAATRSALDIADPTTTNSTKAAEESDPGAVMYIIVVLVFYSTGVMVMIVRYLRTEKKELEEEVTLENFFKSMPDKRTEKEYRVNRMAIHAFHTLTSISYEDDQLDGLDLGSDTETDSRDRKSSDATSSQPLLANDL